MLNPVERFPDDLAVEDLLEPKPETLERLKDTFARLDEVGLVEEFENNLFTITLGSQSFNNGSAMYADSAHGNTKSLAELSELIPIRFVHILTPEGIIFEYSESVNSPVNLYVQPPRKRSTSVPLREYLDGIAADKREAEQLGVSNPTEGTVNKFIQVVNAALTSGKA